MGIGDMRLRGEGWGGGQGGREGGPTHLLPPRFQLLRHSEETLARSRLFDGRRQPWRCPSVHQHRAEIPGVLRVRDPTGRIRSPAAPSNTS